MALTQFNEWEPQLDPVNGRQAQEPRVFAHDAHPVVVGAINNSHSTHGINITNAGINYAVGDTITLSTPTAGGPLERAILTVLAVNLVGGVTDYEVTTPGALYAINEAATQAATSGVGAAFTCTVVNIDIPNTQKRGCCVYVGAAAGLTSLTVVMEAGGDPVTFKTVSGGTILPILIKRVTSAIATNDVIALY
tara:strand:- start:562 stop:1140 length:579 start_codon:yes stop_codon:yes gene_type:complete